MKAVIDSQNRIKILDPMYKIRQLQLAGDKLGYEKFNEDELFKCLSKLLSLEKRWIPNKRGYSLQIRIIHIATSVSGFTVKGLMCFQPSLSLILPLSTKLIVYLFPSCDLPPKQRIKLFADTSLVRCPPNGFQGQYNFQSFKFSNDFIYILRNYCVVAKENHELRQKGQFNEILWMFEGK